MSKNLGDFSLDSSRFPKRIELQLPPDLADWLQCTSAAAAPLPSQRVRSRAASWSRLSIATNRDGRARSGDGLCGKSAEGLNVGDLPPEHPGPTTSLKQIHSNATTEQPLAVLCCQQEQVKSRFPQNCCRARSSRSSSSSASLRPVAAEVH
jgi:hypothetical protein